MNRGHVPKAAVPKRDEKPIHGLVSDKNFIVANAVENILAGKCLLSNRSFLSNWPDSPTRAFSITHFQHNCRGWLGRWRQLLFLEMAKFEFKSYFFGIHENITMGSRLPVIASGPLCSAVTDERVEARGFGSYEGLC